MIGSGGGGGDASAEQRRLEEERQRRVNEGVARVNAIFSGGRVGTGQVDPGGFQYGRTYYDRSGNPVTVQPQTEPTSIVETRRPNWMQNDPGGKVARAGPARQIPAAQYYAKAFGSTPLYSGVSESEGYNDQYFDTIADAYLNYYRPQLEEQYERARRNVTLNSPSRGSGYLRNLGDLDTDYQRESVALGERAQGERMRAKQDVESNRSQLIRAAEAGSAPDVVAQQAVEASKFLRQPPAYSPLGDLFQRTAATVANAKAAQRGGYEWRSPPLFFDRSRKRSSAMNVG